MEILYTRNANKAYMILTELDSLEEGEEESNFETQMLEKNELHTLMGYYPVSYNGEIQYWYDISGLSSLRNYLDREGLSGEILCQLVMDLGLAMKEINNYLLSEGKLFISPETVYISQREGKIETKLCYCPALERPLWEQMRELFEFFLPLVDHEKKEEMNLCYRLYRILSEEDISVDRLLEEVSPLKNCGGVSNIEKEAVSFRENYGRPEPEQPGRREASFGEKNSGWKGKESAKSQGKEVGQWKEKESVRKGGGRPASQSRVELLFQIQRIRESIRNKIHGIFGGFRDDRKLLEEDRIFDPEDPSLDQNGTFQKIEVGPAECYTQGDKRRPDWKGY